MENEVQEPAPKYNYISPEEYLAAERASEEKHEYLDGYVFSMSGTSLKHTQIATNLFRHIGMLLKPDECEMLQSSLRVSTPSRDAYVYPDALIVCGKPELEDDKFDTLVNPVVVFEILSRSTRGIDKGRKAILYQEIPSLKEYIMIDSLSMTVQHMQKQRDGNWLMQIIKSGNVFIQSVGLQISIEDIYRKVEF